MSIQVPPVADATVMTAGKPWKAKKLWRQPKEKTAAEAMDKEANSKLAALLAREQAVADYKEQHAAALQATEAADQVRGSCTTPLHFAVRHGKVLGSAADCS